MLNFFLREDFLEGLFGMTFWNDFLRGPTLYIKKNNLKTWPPKKSSLKKN